MQVGDNVQTTVSVLINSNYNLYLAPGVKGVIQSVSDDAASVLFENGIISTEFSLQWLQQI